MQFFYLSNLLCMYCMMCIYTQRERERERERVTHTHTHADALSLCLFVAEMFKMFTIISSIILSVRVVKILFPPYFFYHQHDHHGICMYTTMFLYPPPLPAPNYTS